MTGIKKISLRSGGIRLAYVSAPLDECKEALEKKGYRIANAEDVARGRIVAGFNSRISLDSFCTRDAFVYDPEKGVFLSRSPVMLQYAQEATQAHREGKEFYLTETQRDYALKNSVPIPKDLFSIPTHIFASSDITKFLFGDIADQYGNFLLRYGISEVPIWTALTKERPYAVPIRLGGLPESSILAGMLFHPLHEQVSLPGLKFTLDSQRMDMAS